jgi:hypothetical protein
MILVLVSTIVQMVELRAPYVRSVALELVLSVVIRKTDVIQTLGMVSLNRRSNEWRYVQDSKPEDHCEAPLLTIRKLQAFHDRHRKKQYPKVPENVCHSIGVPECSEINASALDRVVPHSLDRSAFEDGRSDTARCIQNYVTQGDVDGFTEPANVRKDA